MRKLKRVLKFTKSRRIVPRVRQKPNARVEWGLAPDVEKRISSIVKLLSLDGIKLDSIVCMRSHNSKARAYARIWGLSRVWQIALSENPKYIIEVLSERWDRLPDKQKDEVLIHELAHIPKNFSGSLIPHIKRGKRNFHRQVNTLVAQYRKLK